MRKLTSGRLKEMPEVFQRAVKRSKKNGVSVYDVGEEGKTGFGTCSRLREIRLVKNTGFKVPKKKIRSVNHSLAILNAKFGNLRKK
jgi:hypothetical protein